MNTDNITPWKPTLNSGQNVEIITSQKQGSTDKTPKKQHITGVEGKKGHRPGNTVSDASTDAMNNQKGTRDDRDQRAKDLKLTRKQKAFADYLLNNPKDSATEAIKQTYGAGNKELSRLTASVMATENLRKPSIMLYLDSFATEAEKGVAEIAEYSKQFGKQGTKEGASYAGVALSAYKDVLDRVHGKATQRTEVVSTGIQINIDLTQGDVTEVEA